MKEIKMLLKVNHGGTEQWVKVEEGSFSEFINSDFTVLQQAGTSSSSLTDTMSISTSLSSDSDAGSQMIQPVMNSTHERNILQDFSLMFGAETASRFLEQLNTSFKDNVIQEARALKETPLLKKLLTSALNEGSDTADQAEWDSDMPSLLVLMHLLTPQPAGRKRPKKISVSEATDHLVKFHKSFQSLEDHLLTIEGNPQPYLLAPGTSKQQVSSFYIVLGRKLLP